MKLSNWYSKRGPKFIYQRGKAILERQGLSSSKSIQRVEKCVETLSNLNCSPTLPTPGEIVARYPKQIQNLQEMGVEISIHSYHHINLSELTLQKALRQLEKAVEIFNKFGIEIHGFRCPYLGFTPELIDSLPEGLFKYSSNESIYWQPKQLTSNNLLFFNTLKKFYQGGNCLEAICVPQKRSNLVEIPVCVPDDLQLRDGLKIEADDIFNEWKSIQNEIYKRGELYTLLFHPELARICHNPFIALLESIQNSSPAVWVARLRDISDWWLEKSKFRIDSNENFNDLTIKFRCTPRATILAKQLNDHTSSEFWYGNYYRVLGNQITIQEKTRPFIGITNDVSDSVISFLKEQGYLLDSSEKARQCSIFLDNKINNFNSSNLKLIEYIESFSVPLVRYWRWPNGARSALSITGDLDALSLFDYAARIFY